MQLCFVKIRFIFITTISFDHSLKFNSTGAFSSNIDQIDEQDVKEEFEAQRHKLHFVYLWLNLIIFILLLTIIYKSLCFWFRYLTDNDFENFYITEAFEDYDDQYYQIMGLRVLPLSNCEDNKFVKVSFQFSLTNIFLLFRSLDKLNETSGQRIRYYLSFSDVFGDHRYTAFMHLLCGLQSL